MSCPTRFARSMSDKFAGVAIETWDHDCPILAHCHANFECSIAYTYAGGDHVIFVGRVERMACDTDRRPLLYYRGAYHRLPPPVDGMRDIRLLRRGAFALALAVGLALARPRRNPGREGQRDPHLPLLQDRRRAGAAVAAHRLAGGAPCRRARPRVPT